MRVTRVPTVEVVMTQAEHDRLVSMLRDYALDLDSASGREVAPRYRQNLQALIDGLTTAEMLSGGRTAHILPVDPPSDPA